MKEVKMTPKSDMRKIYENSYHALRFMRYAKCDEGLIPTVRKYRVGQAVNTLEAGYRLEPQAVIAAISSFHNRSVSTHKKERENG